MIAPDSLSNKHSTVVVTRCVNYQPGNIEQAVQKQFSLLGPAEKFISRNDSVLLKPNFIVPRGAQLAVQTDPAIVLAVAKVVKDLGAKPFVGDSPAWNNTSACIKALGLAEPLRKLNVPVKQLNHPTRHKIAGSRIAISTVALQADKIINLPKFKAHQQLGATFAIKNMFGCVCGKEKAFWHFAKGKSYDNFCLMLIEIFKLLNPVLTIIDGVVAMEGMGPINGKAKPLGFLIGGTDPIACELICCELIKFGADNLPIIQKARQIGFGCSDLNRIDVKGDDYTGHICRDFEPARQTPLHFSFSHICKSVTKQLIFLAKSVIPRGD